MPITWKSLAIWHFNCRTRSTLLRHKYVQIHAVFFIFIFIFSTTPKSNFIEYFTRQWATPCPSTYASPYCCRFLSCLAGKKTRIWRIVLTCSWQLNEFSFLENDEMLCGICNDIQRGQFISINHFLVWHAEVTPSTIDSLTLIRFARFMRKLSKQQTARKRESRERETRAKQTRKPGRQAGNAKKMAVTCAKE